MLRFALPAAWVLRFSRVGIVQDKKNVSPRARENITFPIIGIVSYLLYFLFVLCILMCIT